MWIVDRVNRIFSYNFSILFGQDIFSLFFYLFFSKEAKDTVWIGNFLIISIFLRDKDERKGQEIVDMSDKEVDMK